MSAEIQILKMVAAPAGMIARTSYTIKLAYYFRRNCFAVKHPDFLRNAADFERLHCVSYSGCNFRCRNCYVSTNKTGETHFSLSEDEFTATICSMLPYGRGFKFTGGEPTSSPVLLRDMDIVAKHNGFIFLDTNGSRPELIRTAIDRHLVEVLGISIKGLTPDESIANSGATRSQCWDAPLETLEYASKTLQNRVIATYVYDRFSIETVEAFASFLSPFSKIIMKLNRRILLNEHHAVEESRSTNIGKTVEQFLGSHPEWTNRIVVIDNDRAVSDSRNALFF